MTRNTGKINVYKNVPTTKARDTTTLTAAVARVTTEAIETDQNSKTKIKNKINK